jgi:type III secretory pathway component EscT
MGISLITLADAFINIIQREPTKTAAIVITYTIIFIIAVLTLLTAIAIILK